MSKVGRNDPCQCGSGKKYKKCCLITEDGAAAQARRQPVAGTPKTEKEDAPLERFGMTSPPEVGGQPGDYEERWAQWFLEQSFFRDFVYRNPQGKRKGTELADGLVLFSGVALLVQVKAQCGKHDPVSWATEKLLDALKQLKNTHEQLDDGGIAKLDHELYGTAPFVPAKYPNHFGIIVLAQEQGQPFDAVAVVPELLTAGFPVHVFSLQDFKMIAERFDTAADFITFLEFRTDVMPREQYIVHDEEANIRRIIPHLEEVLTRHMSPSSPEEMAKTVASVTATATGRFLSSPDRKFGFAIDDIIARAHDTEAADPARRRKNLAVAEFLGWLSRGRRITVGRKFVEQCRDAQDGEDHYFVHAQPARGTACVYLSTSKDRPTRYEFLRFLIAYAQMKHGVQQCLGVATEPIGPGRSYDFALVEGPMPEEVAAQLRTAPDPFGTTAPLSMQE
jgi:hypothetical protein